MRKITINEKEISLNDFSFSDMVKMEKLGFSIADFREDKPFTIVAVLLALAEKCDVDSACKDIEEHLEKGGKFDDFTPLIENLTNSGFFQKMSKQVK